MPMSSLVAAKIIGEITNWTVTRPRVHKLLYICQLRYAYRNNGASLINNEMFVADNVGPVLKDLDKRIFGFGAGKYKNLFRQFRYSPSDLETEIDLIKETVEHYQNKETSYLNSLTMRRAWSNHYNSSASGVKYHISQKSIFYEAVLAINNNRKVEVLNKKFNFPLTVEDLELVEINDNIVKSYTMTDHEKKLVSTLFEIFGTKEKEFFIPIENSDLFYFKNINKLSDTLMDFLSYRKERDQDIFMYEYLN